MKKWLEYMISELFSNKKCRGLGPWLVDQRSARSMVDRPPWPAVELTRAQPSDRSGPWLLAARWGKGGCHGDSILPSTEAWKVAHWRRNFDLEGRVAFYRAKARQGRPGAFNGRRQCLGLKAPVTGVKSGGGGVIAFN
jgi:hypothetical protein